MQVSVLSHALVYERTFDARRHRHCARRHALERRARPISTRHWRRVGRGHALKTNAGTLPFFSFFCSRSRALSLFVFVLIFVCRVLCLCPCLSQSLFARPGCDRYLQHVRSTSVDTCFLSVWKVEDTAGRAQSSAHDDG